MPTRTQAQCLPGRGVQGVCDSPHKAPVAVCPTNQVTHEIIPDDTELGDVTNAWETRLSLADHEAPDFWLHTKQLMKFNLPVTVMVERVNQGGLVVKYGDHRGFVPKSYFCLDGSTKAMEECVGRPMLVKIREVNQKTLKLIFSGNLLSAQESMKRLKVGDLVLGTVRGVKRYGAFVDFNGMTGLLHVSQISYDRVKNAKEVLREGTKLKVMILTRDSERVWMTLTTKYLEATPGDMLRDLQLVFDGAEKMAAIIRERLLRKKIQTCGDGRSEEVTGGTQPE